MISNKKYYYYKHYFFLPKLSDYRIHSNNSTLFKVVKDLSIGITYIATFDTHPAIDIPKYQYRLMNGLTYTFDWEYFFRKDKHFENKINFTTSSLQYIIIICVV